MKLKQLIYKSCLADMISVYIPYYITLPADHKREDGIPTQKLRFARTSLDGKLETQHRLASFSKRELEELMKQLGYEDDCALMKETPETYASAMIAMIEMHLDEDLEAIKANPSVTDLEILVIADETPLQAAIYKHLGIEPEDDEEDQESEPSGEDINNSNIEVE